MNLLESLRREHSVIEAVALAFVGYARASTADESFLADGERFLQFFRLYAGSYHHAREERVLFPALVHETEVPEGRGPLAAILRDHADMSRRLAEAETLLATKRVDAKTRARLAEVATGYATALLHHIDAENSVLFPEAEARFRRVSVLTLENRPPNEAERAAHAVGVELVARHPAPRLPEVFRGEGCVCCPSFGISCDGVEREWSSDEEWEDMIERVGK